MQILSRDETGQAPMRGLIYGDPKTGKTPLALQLPFGPDKPLGEALYIAADDGSWRLTSCPPEQRKFIHVVRPIGEGKKWDPGAEAFNVVMTNWKDKENWPDGEDWSNIRTVIWDTVSETAMEILGDIADKGQFSKEGHIAIGGVNSPGKFNLPIPGDYNGAQGAIERLTKLLFRQPLNIICIYHTDIMENDDGKMVVGGPATIGKATIRKVAKLFDWVLRIEKKPVFNSETKKSEQQIIIHTDAAGVWIGGPRIAGKNPMPSVTVPNDKPFSLFWPKFFEAFPAVSVGAASIQTS